MRQLLQEQLPLVPFVRHPHAEEMWGIDGILSENAGMLELVLQDLAWGVPPGEGREGMTADQVLRAALVKQLNLFSYRELSFHLEDSVTYRAFCGFGMAASTPSFQTLQTNIKRISAETWQAINRIVLGVAEEQGIEDGRKVRVDGTVTLANIHPPSDSSLLWDCARVLTRLTLRGHEDFGVERYPDRTRRAKRRMMDVMNSKNVRKRTKAYRALLKVTRDTVGNAEATQLALVNCNDVMARALAAEIGHYTRLAHCVIDQTERRVLHGENVPAEQKIFSIFEDHTDIIIKDNRDVHYGHKLTITGGSSGLVLDWVVEDGNPADSNLAIRMLERQAEIYGHVPRQAVFDGCYASKLNLEQGKKLGVEDLAFSKKRGLEVLDMAKSARIYQRLRNFRAGIESWISFLKRAVGLDRCTWRGWAGFGQYVGASIVAANLLTFVRSLK
jgi:transposase, IS5 family